MFTCEIILAAALVTAPKDIPVSTQTVDYIAIIRPTILTIAVDGEILDPRERTFLFTQDSVGDLTMLRTRNEELVSMPHLGEYQSFPDRKQINDLLAVNRSYRNDLTNRLTIDLVHLDEIRTAICETDQLYQAWDTLRDAQCDYYYVTVRRQSLGLLRTLIGSEAYYQRRMPPNLPVWHLPRR